MWRGGDSLPVSFLQQVETEEGLGLVLDQMGVKDGQSISFENFWTLINKQAVQQFASSHKEKNISCGCYLMWNPRPPETTLLKPTTTGLPLKPTWDCLYLHHIWDHLTDTPTSTCIPDTTETTWDTNTPVRITGLINGGRQEDRGTGRCRERRVSPWWSKKKNI